MKIAALAAADRSGSMREFAFRPGRTSLEMRVDLKTREQTFVATSRNIGLGGMFVATDRQLPVGDRLTVEVALPKHVRPMTVLGEVRWAQATDGRPSGIGLRFVSPSFAVTVAIHELLRKVNGPRTG